MHELKSKLYIPLTVKLSPFFASIDNMVLKLVNIAGADGVVMFNRFCYPDFDIHNLNLQLRAYYDAHLPLTGISKLYNKLPVSIAASTGVDNSSDIIKFF